MIPNSCIWCVPGKDRQNINSVPPFFMWIREETLRRFVHQMARTPPSQPPPKKPQNFIRYFLAVSILLRYISGNYMWGNQPEQNEGSIRKIKLFQINVWYCSTVTSQNLLTISIITQQSLHQKLQAKFTCPYKCNFLVPAESHEQVFITKLAVEKQLLRIFLNEQQQVIFQAQYLGTDKEMEFLPL